MVGCCYFYCYCYCHCHWCCCCPLSSLLTCCFHLQLLIPLLALSVSFSQSGQPTNSLCVCVCVLEYEQATRLWFGWLASRVLALAYVISVCVLIMATRSSVARRSARLAKGNQTKLNEFSLNRSSWMKLELKLSLLLAAHSTAAKWSRSANDKWSQQVACFNVVVVVVEDNENRDHNWEPPRGWAHYNTLMMATTNVARPWAPFPLAKASFFLFSLNSIN